MSRREVLNILNKTISFMSVLEHENNKSIVQNILF